MPTPSKMVLEGLSSVRGENRYPGIEFPVENVTMKTWKPSSDTKLATDGVIRMQLRPDPNELVRYEIQYLIVRFVSSFFFLLPGFWPIRSASSTRPTTRTPTRRTPEPTRKRP